MVERARRLVSVFHSVGTAPESATIQFNPKVVFQETTAMLYADRRAVAADPSCNTTFGGDSNLCAPIVSQLSTLYAGSVPGTEGVCINLPVDLLVAKDTDPVWRDRQSWVWREKPIFHSEFVRLFTCRQTHASVH
jgi:hypothetical protein